GGEGYQGPDARDRAIADLRAAGADRLFPLLAALLSHSDPEMRCQACEAIVLVYAQRRVDLVLPLLAEADAVVRWHVGGLMHDVGGERAVGPLVERMRIDPDPQVRGTAAYALGGIGSPQAVPALLETRHKDHEADQLGHTPSSCAQGALE